VKGQRVTEETPILECVWGLPQDGLENVDVIGVTAARYSEKLQYQELLGFHYFPAVNLLRPRVSSICLSQLKYSLDFMITVLDSSLLPQANSSERAANGPNLALFRF